MGQGPNATELKKQKQKTQNALQYLLNRKAKREEKVKKLKDERQSRRERLERLEDMRRFAKADEAIELHTLYQKLHNDDLTHEKLRHKNKIQESQTKRTKAKTAAKDALNMRKIKQELRRHALTPAAKNREKLTAKIEKLAAKKESLDRQHKYMREIAPRLKNKIKEVEEALNNKPSST